MSKELTKLEEILNEMDLKSIKYRGVTWKIGDKFNWLGDKKVKYSDYIDSIDIVHYKEKDSKIYQTELRLCSENYAVDINECFKTKN